MKFSEIFNKLCDETNTSYKKIAEMLGYSPQAVSKWGRGETEPNLDTLNKLSEYFNVSTDYLLGNSESKKIDTPYDDELEKVLFSKAKDLTDDEKKTIINVINAIKKEVDKELDK